MMDWSDAYLLRDDTLGDASYVNQVVCFDLAFVSSLFPIALRMLLNQF